FLPFKGDAEAVKVKDKLKNAIHRRMRFCFRTNKLFNLGTKDRLSKGLTSGVVYEFRCACGANYVGQTTRRLEDQEREHLAGRKSAVGEHLEGCEAEANTSNFSVLYEAKGCNFQSIIELVRAEALLINNRTPTLCKQREENKIKLALPWNQVLDPPRKHDATLRPKNVQTKENNAEKDEGNPDVEGKGPDPADRTKAHN
ncbi:hypothetical protein Ciccas_011827, partial [Cichlidogyrus casuarinus]